MNSLGHLTTFKHLEKKKAKIVKTHRLKIWGTLKTHEGILHKDSELYPCLPEDTAIWFTSISLCSILHNNLVNSELIHLSYIQLSNVPTFKVSCEDIKNKI